jgi:hypothetical protein
MRTALTLRDGKRELRGNNVMRLVNETQLEVIYLQTNNNVYVLNNELHLPHKIKNYKRNSLLLVSYFNGKVSNA